MLIQKGRIGVFYSCSNRLTKGCTGTINADQLGNPVKEDDKSRILRVKAQLIIENLWRNNLLPTSKRKKIFESLCKKLNINKMDFDIKQFSMTRCKTVIAFVNQKVKENGRKTSKKPSDSKKSK
jgi:hypothetical protein